MLVTKLLNRFRFSTITHIRGRAQLKSDDQVELRGIRIQSTNNDSPNLIFIPEIFDQAENWLQFFSNPNNKIIQQRNVWIIYPRNFGNSDRNPLMSWETHANDVLRFMYNNQISMATIGGHGLGGKVAFATACHHHNYITGFFGIDTVPYNQYYYEPFHELRSTVQSLATITMNRAFNSISLDLKNKVKDPKWRKIFESNIVKHDNTYAWKFNHQAIWNNIKSDSPSSMVGWHSSVGLYPGRVCWTFPDNSRFVHINTNTLPMMKSCPHSKGFNHDIFSIQGDQGVQNHWVYERQDEINPYAWRIAHFLRHYDGVHVLLQSRDEVGRVYIPDIHKARNPQQQIAEQRTPGHYYHNWRFNNVYQKGGK